MILMIMDIQQDYIDGKTTTDFIERNFSTWTDENRRDFLRQALIAASFHSKESVSTKVKSMQMKRASPWNTLGKWRIGHK